MNAVETRIITEIGNALKELYGLVRDEGFIMIETPRDPKMGDYATNIAMRLAKELHRNPFDIANEIAAVLREKLTEASSVEAARPGFINFRMKGESLADNLKVILEEGDAYGRNDSGKGQKILVEWVSANPTGDLHCGHARNAAWGDSISRLLEASGYDNLREYYINDAGNQIVMLGESLTARYFEHFGKEYPLPEDGYHAQDIIDIADAIAETDGDRWLYEEDAEKRLEYFKKEGVRRELKKIEKDLEMFGVRFDSWMHETFFYENGGERINAVLERMQRMGLTYEKDGALWFRSSEYGDDKDRVLKKSDGTYAYLTPDIANHVYKYERGYRKLVDLWGADHHSYITRMKCALTALGYDRDLLDVDIIQMVRMVEDGVEVKMSKRTGNAITIRELVEDVGCDAARWFFVSKDVSSHMDFDFNFARKKSEDNPVYYAQYAHARMCSILRQCPELKPVETYDLLTDQKEIELMKYLNEFPTVVADAARTRMPNKICQYIQTVARLFHSFYGVCRVNDSANPELSNQRAALVTAAKITMKNALYLIGVSAPEKM
ncbi:MAG: arginine--tRNA ligase [Solobacterium sp.]|nr:arginine--tRNA ligase [Solobacterium sp.]